MTNRQTNIRCSCRQPVSPACSFPARRPESCPDTRNDLPEGFPPAMAYVPWQQWRDIYELCTGFRQGTIFRELDKPFLRKGGRCK